MSSLLRNALAAACVIGNCQRSAERSTLSIRKCARIVTHLNWFQFYQMAFFTRSYIPHTQQHHGLNLRGALLNITGTQERNHMDMDRGQDRTGQRKRTPTPIYMWILEVVFADHLASLISGDTLHMRRQCAYVMDPRARSTDHSDLVFSIIISRTPSRENHV